MAATFTTYLLARKLYLDIGKPIVLRLLGKHPKPTEDKDDDEPPLGI
jgi:hypothetical protein